MRLEGLSAEHIFMFLTSAPKASWHMHCYHGMEKQEDKKKTDTNKSKEKPLQLYVLFLGHELSATFMRVFSSK